MVNDILILKALSWLVDDACKRKLALTEEDERLRGELREAVRGIGKQTGEPPGIETAERGHGCGQDIWRIIFGETKKKGVKI